MNSPARYSARSGNWVHRTLHGIGHAIGQGIGRALGAAPLDISVPRVFLYFLVGCALLYLRSPFSNSIFDEQEALLANPYVNGEGIGLFQVLERDFWGLPPDRSIGSYRPLPNLIWRCLWVVHDHPWVPHAFNVIVHALNATLITCIAFRWTGSRGAAWLSGVCFACSAILTETVSGAVGLADVLSGLGILTALSALSLPMTRMGFGVFAACTLGMFSKESSVANVAIVPFAALISSRLLHPAQPRSVLRALVAMIASACALILYVETRRFFFPSPIDAALIEPARADWHWARSGFHDLLRWFAQPQLPHDPINNPLIGVAWPQRIATALRVYASGLGQVLWPFTLSGDYSYAAELPETSPLSASGAIWGLLMALPLIGALGLLARSFWKSETLAAGQRGLVALLAVALLIVPVCYFPQSNILVLLPTIRAERFWYTPVLGSSWLLGCFLARLTRGSVPSWCSRVAPWGVGLFLGFQAVQARRHALDYSSDLHFWRATAAAAPNSAKAHLNYGVMLGARGDLTRRLSETERARQIAPQWPMAHVYYGDTLCRMQRADQAWPHYLRGFELGPNEPNLIALGLQCLWDQQQFAPHQEELTRLAAKFPDSWLDYLVTDTAQHGAEQGGVDKKYRPRGYDEGPTSP